ncbi:MAG TPA: NADH-quinone oxidoreductase subunit N [Methanomassiliicoccales archaeon]|nr:NADH-quinone oxidoreductase subunit N [Methanomassiliicoccales archaeon]
MADYSVMYPEIVLAIFALAAPAIRAVTKNDKATAGWALIGVAGSMLFTAAFFYDGSGAGTFANLLRLDAFSALFMLVFQAVALYVIIASIKFVDREKHTGEYYALIMLATVGMMVVASSLDLITLFVGIELTSLSSYALVAFRKKDKKGAEAATKYFIIGGLSSALALFGISLLYGVVGTTNFALMGSQLALATSESLATILLAAVMILAGFGFKVAIVPFHMWAPDVYEGAPTTITAMLAAGSKKMGFVALFKVFLIGMIAVRADWMGVAAIIAIITMTLGNLIAISQTSIKRMLAYSSIAQAGYILIALPVAAVSDPTVAAYGLTGGIFHIVTHAFMKGGAFIVVASLSMAALGDKLDDFKGLSKRAPLTAFAFAIMLFSLAGIPPLAGFDSKFVLFSGPVYASQIAGNEWMIWLAVAGVLNSALSLYYYARVVKYMYVEKGPESRLHISPSMSVAVAICFVAVVVIGLYPQPVIDACTQAAHAFFLP